MYTILNVFITGLIFYLIWITHKFQPKSFFTVKKAHVDIFLSFEICQDSFLYYEVSQNDPDFF